ncbi:MAG: penicillin-binding protein 1B [Gammaproteobacteria bacterium]
MAHDSSSSERPSQQRTRRERRKRAKTPRAGHWSIQYGVLGIMLVLLLVAGGFLRALDHTVRSQFEGKRWALPARVYARPLELFVDLPLTPDDLTSELTSLGYRRPEQPDGPGSFTRQGDTIHFITRAFRFWDGAEPSVPVQAVFRRSRLVSLRHAQSGEPLPVVRLHPPLIGSIYPAHHEDRILVRLSDVPPVLIKALIAVEDQRFYAHHGVDPRALGRALWANLRARAAVQGGSTLTQQLVKNFYLQPERLLWRKLQEALMALLLEWHYSKDDILEAYLNEIFLGQEGQRAIHGFGLASQFYFGRPVEELTLPQIALLIGLARGASYYNPRRHADRARDRRNAVLETLVDRGVIGAAEAQAAQAAGLGVTPEAPSGVSPYPAFLDLVRRQLRRDYREQDLMSEGLQVFTTLEPRVQKHAQQVLATRLAPLEKQRGLSAGALQGAVVVTRSQLGEVVALAGGRDPLAGGFNRALDAVRPIGSLIKPAIYLTALSRPADYTLVTSLDDRPLRLQSDGKDWTPENFDHQYHGAVPLYLALAHSYNLATVHLGLALGVPQVLETVKRLGITRALDAHPSTLLGTMSLPPLEVTQMYQTLASGGFRTPLRTIREVLTTAGEPLQRYALAIEQVADPASVFLLTAALQEAVRHGTGRVLSRPFATSMAVAGKTGTTDDLRDSWFAGFTGDYLAVVWLGRDNNLPTGLTGATGALPVWDDLMRRISSQPLRLTPPPQVEFVPVDPQGRRTDAYCPGAMTLPFITGTAPQVWVPSCENRKAQEAEQQTPAPSGTFSDWSRRHFR